ncbi:MAG: hypothetical protein A2283_05300 [Lentisphaerae bacterium RIFOXYA12_FULL_48_11]|nr:MAG: hypothetical protein A2283_05300 [Lentisphaerae bacterium RIFOXYA12_FULL_48_11]
MSNVDSDWSLVEQVKQGNDHAFDELMERYKKPVINFIYRMLGNASDAEDMAQDVFVRAYQNICKSAFRIGEGRFSTWLFQIAHNAAIDNLRKRKRQPTETINDMEESKFARAVTDKTADKVLAEQELGNQIANAISELPPDQKTAIVLSEYHDISYSEISEIMKCSEKSVESRLYRAKNTLRQRLAHLLHGSYEEAGTYE